MTTDHTPAHDADALAAARLIAPVPQYMSSYVEMLREHQAKGRFLDSRHMDNNLVRLQRDFPAFVLTLNDAADPTKTRPGRVPEHHRWLLAGAEIAGRATIRTELSDAPEIRDLGHIGYDIRPSYENRGLGNRILALSLARAKEMGLTRAMLTCDSNNIASKKIIEKNGGVFEAAVPIPGRAYERLRYWIDIV